jgi:hypothetical protein
MIPDIFRSFLTFGHWHIITLARNVILSDFKEPNIVVGRA